MGVSNMTDYELVARLLSTEETMHCAFRNCNRGHIGRDVANQVEQSQNAFRDQIVEELKKRTGLTDPKDMRAYVQEKLEDMEELYQHNIDSICQIGKVIVPVKHLEGYPEYIAEVVACYNGPFGKHKSILVRKHHSHKFQVIPEYRMKIFKPWPFQSQYEGKPPEDVGILRLEDRVYNAGERLEYFWWASDLPGQVYMHNGLGLHLEFIESFNRGTEGVMLTRAHETPLLVEVSEHELPSIKKTELQPKFFKRHTAAVPNGALTATTYSVNPLDLNNIPE